MGFSLIITKFVMMVLFLMHCMGHSFHGSTVKAAAFLATYLIPVTIKADFNLHKWDFSHQWAIDNHKIRKQLIEATETPNLASAIWNVLMKLRFLNSSFSYSSQLISSRNLKISKNYVIRIVEPVDLIIFVLFIKYIMNFSFTFNNTNKTENQF